MFNYFSLFYIGFLCFVSQVGCGQNRYITGVALNDSTLKPINLAKIVNLRTQDVTRTNKSGTFLLMARTGDLLRLTCTTCEETTIVVDSTGNDTAIRVRQFGFTGDGTTLNEVEVVGKSEAELKHEIEETLKAPAARKNLSTDQVLGMATSPISLLYELFSKRAKGLRQLAVFQQEDRKHKLAETRYNESFVSQVTKLEGAELERFMKFCPVPDDFVLRASEYDLIQKVKDCYHRYKLLPRK
ncbi:MAG: hypothetical protein QM669_09880 [Siphonobacter sp.]